MKLSEEMAVRLHRMMWEDMQKERGDNPGRDQRIRFKDDWIHRMFPGDRVTNNCWLCLYTEINTSHGIVNCSCCPIKWPMGRCNTDKVSYLSSPISEILALPAKNESVAKKAESIHDLSRDIVVGEVAKASGLPVECDIWTHIKKIQDKAVQQSLCSKLYGDTMTELAKASGLPASSAIEDHIKAIQSKAVENDNAQKASIFNALAEASDAFKQYAEKQTEPLKQKIDSLTKRYNAVKNYLAHQSGLTPDGLVDDHIKAIKEKAVEEYFEKQPAAKLATMDVDDAFKQYADEQKAPIFKQLSKASGLSENNQSVFSHIEWIKNKTRQEVQHAAEEEKASHEKDLEILRKTSMQLADKVDRYKDALSKRSGLDRNRPVDDHIREIVRNSMEAGATEEQERIMNRIGELLNHDFD